MLRISFGAMIIGAVLALGFAGFRGQKGGLTHVEWFSDMAHQPKNQPQHRSEFFNDGRAARLPVPGTVPIGFQLEGRYAQTGANNDGGTFTVAPDYFNTGRIGENYGDGIPDLVKKDPVSLLARGQERYGIYCSHCHGVSGAGDGPVKALGFVTIASLITPGPIVDQPDGKIFNTITHGRSTMGAHGPVIAVEDRWALVAYVRALQKAGSGKFAVAAPAAAPAATNIEKK
jgi:mono/diheme cytochrome c family protein